MNISKPIVLVILDGWGEWDMPKGNPLVKAQLPTIDKLNKHYPKTILQASGMAVGLPWGVRGNSEVGHQTIGSGQIIFQFLPAISSSIGDGTFFKNEILLNSITHVKKNKSSLHLIGLLSDGGVHSHIEHLFALLEMAKKENVKDVFVHAITDGRDTHPKSAKQFLDLLQRKMSELGVGKIATISGRYFAMDRNNNWDRIEKSFKAMTRGEGVMEKDCLKAIDSQYEKKIKDEYLEPVVMLGENELPIGLVKNNDSIVCFNFRKDRSRQITRAFTQPEFKEFKDEISLKGVKYTCFVEYKQDSGLPIAFKIKEISTRLGEIISKAGKKQFRISETEKYAHVTYFFNGGVEKPYPGEDRKLIPSKNVPSYDKEPGMSVFEINEELLKTIDSGEHDFIVVNFANADMVGHTGNVGAAVLATELVDKCLDKLIEKVLKKEGTLIVTADHGNVEEMINIYTGEIDTQHSKNPVPCWYVSTSSYSENVLVQENSKNIDGMLIDIAPTILDLMDISKPKDMIGISLIKKFKDKLLG